jgi:hypothetical protein
MRSLIVLLGLTALATTAAAQDARELSLREAERLCQPHANFRSANPDPNNASGYEAGWEMCKDVHDALRPFDEAIKAALSVKRAEDKKRCRSFSGPSAKRASIERSL